MLSPDKDYHGQLIKVVTPTVVEIQILENVLEDETITVNIDGVDHQDIHDAGTTATAMAWVAAKLYGDFIVNIREENGTLFGIFICEEDTISVNHQMLDIGFNAPPTLLPEFY